MVLYDHMKGLGKTANKQIIFLFLLCKHILLHEDFIICRFTADILIVVIY